MSVPKKDIDSRTESRSPRRTRSSLCLKRRRPSRSNRCRSGAGSLAAGRAAIVHYAKLAPSRPGVYRMIDARGDVLYVGKAKNIKKRIRAYARPTGLDTRIERMIAATADARIRRHAHRDRSAAARSQSHQALAAALQRGVARRQVVSLHPDHRRSLGAANPQASRRAHAAGPLLRAVRLGLGGQPHHQCAAARLPVALLQRCLFREPHPAVPAVSDQALLGAVHRRDRLSRICRTGARSQCVPLRPQQGGQG